MRGVHSGQREVAGYVCFSGWDVEGFLYPRPDAFQLPNNTSAEAQLCFLKKGSSAVYLSTSNVK